MTNSPASSPQGLFYNIKAEAPWCEVRIPEVPRTLLCNYRSHAGIMDIANEVIKLITRSFPTRSTASSWTSAWCPRPESLGGLCHLRERGTMTKGLTYWFPCFPF